MNHYVQTKACEREKQCKPNANGQSLEHTESDEDDDSDHETDADSRFSFTRTVADEVHTRKRNVT